MLVNLKLLCFTKKNNFAPLSDHMSTHLCLVQSYEVNGTV